MHAITPRLFSKDVYSVPLRLRALRLRVCVMLDRGGGGGWLLVTKMFPDVQTFFRSYNNFSENTVVFQIHFHMS
jgi:hypothetical protein